MPANNAVSPYNLVHIRLKHMKGSGFIEKINKLKIILIEEGRSELISKWLNEFLQDNTSPSDKDYLVFSKSIDSKLNAVMDDLIFGVELNIIKIVFKWFNECLKNISLEDLTGNEAIGKPCRYLLFEFHKKHSSKDIIHKLDLQILKITRVLNSLKLEIFSKDLKSKVIRDKLSKGESYDGKNLEDIKLLFTETIELLSNDNNNDNDISLKLLPSTLRFSY